MPSWWSKVGIFIFTISISKGGNSANKLMPA